jgi:hypothetical protein
MAPERLSRLQRRILAWLAQVVDTDNIHQATAVESWLAAHPRLTWRLLPTDGPHANPIARACGDGYVLCPRNQQRNHVPDWVADVEAHWHVNGPWQYRLSPLYDGPTVTTAVEKIAVEEQAKAAA